ncbi:MAG TPA: hypothetical protein EYQ74_08125 [Planctomycetes bacterium]|nr:hypothetical protein [Planctomycetota bacterium]HIK60408.1 hypothetical protein [Planctomycetota bacterium]
MKTSRSIHSSRAGVSLIEVVLAASLMSLLARALVESANSMSLVTSRGSIRALLQIEGQKAVKTMISELGSSAIRTVNGKSYPYTFDDAEAAFQYAAHTHNPPTMGAVTGDSDFGTLREIVFVRTADLDTDGRPDMDTDLNGVPELDGDGDGMRSESFADLDGIWVAGENTVDSVSGVIWPHTEWSYVLTTRADGINCLQRRMDADPTTDQTIATHVERIQVDTAATCQWTIPLNSVRVQIFFRRHDERGVLFRYTTQVVVALKNA